MQFIRACAPSPENKLRPQNDNFWGILMHFLITYRCNNRVQNPFSVPYNLLRVFEDDNTIIHQLYTELSQTFLVTSILGQFFNCAIRTPVFRCSSSLLRYTHCETVYRPNVTTIVYPGHLRSWSMRQFFRIGPRIDSHKGNFF